MVQKKSVMRILELANRIPWPARDGGSQCVVRAARALAPKVEAYRLFCFNTTKHWIEPDNIPTFFKEELDLHWTYLDNRIHPWGLLKNWFSSRSYHIERFFSPELESEIRNQILDFNPELIQFNGPTFLPYLPLFRQFPHIKLVMRAHNVEYQIWERIAKNTSNPIKRFYLKEQSKRLKKIELENYPFLDGILPISPLDAQCFQHWVPQEKIHLTPSGIDLPNFHPQPERNNPEKTCFLAAMDWMPNQEALDWLLSFWSQEFPPLFVAGRFMPKKYFKKQSSKVQILGEVENANEFLFEHGIVLIPLLSGSGIRIKMLEAMALGKAVISTSVGVEGLDLMPNVHYFQANTPQEFLAQIKNLQSNPELAIQIGKNARIHVESHFDITEITRDQMQFYASL